MFEGISLLELLRKRLSEQADLLSSASDNYLRAYADGLSDAIVAIDDLIENESEKQADHLAAMQRGAK